MALFPHSLFPYTLVYALKKEARDYPVLELLTFPSVKRANHDALPLWQCIGMFVLVYAPAYWWAGRYPSRYRHLILIGLLGKVLGPIGFVWAFLHGQLPLAFGLTNITNDVIWWPAFVSYLRAGARLSGGWIPFVLGE